jgi:hypothetical protein
VCAPLAKLPRALLQDGEPKLPWSVRVRGSTRETATMWQASKRWAGEVILPLDEIQVRHRP